MFNLTHKIFISVIIGVLAGTTLTYILFNSWVYKWDVKFNEIANEVSSERKLLLNSFKKLSDRANEQAGTIHISHHQDYLGFEFQEASDAANNTQSIYTSILDNLNLYSLEERNQVISILDLISTMESKELSFDETSHIKRVSGELNINLEIVSFIENRIPPSYINHQSKNIIADLYQREAWSETNHYQARNLHILAEQIRQEILAEDFYNWSALNGSAFADFVAPAFLNRLPDSINKYKKLLQLQNGLPKNEYYAKTYVYLANAYIKLDDSKRALEVLKKGIGEYGDNIEINKMLNVLEQ